MNKRNFIISTGAALALVMLATCYAAVAALRSGAAPRITEEYRQAALTSQGNPFWQLGNDFAGLFVTLGERLSGR